MESVNAWTAQWAKHRNVKHSYLPSIESTNVWAKSEFRWDHTTHVFVADHQSHGRGRGGHSWTNGAPGTTWMSTWAFALNAVPHPLLNMRIGLHLYNAIAATWSNPLLALKAPNDIFTADGKLAGILTEVVTGRQNALFIGIGLNVFSKPELPEQPTQSLSAITSIDKVHWFDFCDHLLSGFNSLLESPTLSSLSLAESDDILKALKKYTTNSVESLLPDGTLILNDGRRRHWNEL